MTRINLGIEPIELCDQHLKAEWRELPRVRHSFNANVHKRAPAKFKLGTGHVLFCAARPLLCCERHKNLYAELLRRNFNPNQQLLLKFTASYHSLPFTNDDYKHARLIMQERLLHKFEIGKPANPTWTNIKQVPSWIPNHLQGVLS